MIMPAWLFGYFLFGGGLYWGLQTFMPNKAAGWTAAGVTIALWFIIRHFRKQAEAEEWAQRDADRRFLEAELAELEARRQADAAS